MLSQPKAYSSRYLVICAGIFTAGMMAVAAYASVQSVHDRRITEEDAARMAEVARQDSDDGFPIVVNDLVLEQLNRFLGTPDGRAYIKGSLAQMQNYQEVIAGNLVKYHLPQELLAVPIVESAYRNTPQSRSAGSGAGLWQFIPATAKNFGLEITDTKDQRLDILLETDAAMRMLSGLNLQFEDWGLAMLAYNGGRNLVERGIEKTRSRDVWQLVRAGFENDTNYMAKIMAAVLILRNPSVLD